MKLFKKVAALTITAAMVFSLGACGSDSSASTDTSVVLTDKIITMAQTSDVQSFDPHGQNNSYSINATNEIYDTLVRLGTDNEFLPSIAESWEFTDDTTVVFHIRDDVKFQDGTDLTAEDCVFSLMREKESSKVGHLVSMIESVDVDDDYTFTVHMNEPSAALISSLIHPGSAILSKAYTEKLEAEGGSLSDAPMGSGPYSFVSWTPGDNFELKRNDNYWGEKPQNGGLIVKIIPEEASRTMALETGEIDVLIDVSLQDVDRIKENTDLTLVEYPSTLLQYMVINTSKAPFDNVLVRKALNCAIDTESIIAVAANGNADALHSYIAPCALGYSDDIVTYAYDPEQAKAYLKEAGYEDGFDCTIMVGNNTRARAAQVIQANLKDVGINLEIEQMDGGVFYEKTGEGAHELGIAGWMANAEPDNTFRPLFHSADTGAGGNRSFHSFPEVDTLIDEAAQNQDMTQRLENYAEAMNILTDEAIWVPLYNDRGLMATSAKVEGLVPYAIGIQRFDTVHFVDDSVSE